MEIIGTLPSRLSTICTLNFIDDQEIGSFWFLISRGNERLSTPTRQNLKLRHALEVFRYIDSRVVGFSSPAWRRLGQTEGCLRKPPWGWQYLCMVGKDDGWWPLWSSCNGDDTGSAVLDEKYLRYYYVTFHRWRTYPPRRRKRDTGRSGVWLPEARMPSMYARYIGLLG